MLAVELGHVEDGAEALPRGGLGDDGVGAGATDQAGDAGTSCTVSSDGAGTTTITCDDGTSKYSREP